jgi:hypothetical protein
VRVAVGAWQPSITSIAGSMSSGERTVASRRSACAVGPRAGERPRRAAQAHDLLARSAQARAAQPLWCSVAQAWPRRAAHPAERAAASKCCTGRGAVRKAGPAGSTATPPFLFLFFCHFLLKFQYFV